VTSPCGQKSESSGKLRPSASAKARNECIGSQEIARISVSKVMNSSSRDRIWLISPVHTLEKAYG
jgi:hypothetical protein